MTALAASRKWQLLGEIRIEFQNLVIGTKNTKEKGLCETGH